MEEGFTSVSWSGASDLFKEGFTHTETRMNIWDKFRMKLIGSMHSSHKGGTGNQPTKSHYWGWSEIMMIKIPRMCRMELRDPSCHEFCPTNTLPLALHCFRSSVLPFSEGLFQFDSFQFFWLPSDIVLQCSWSHFDPPLTFNLKKNHETLLQKLCCFLKIICLPENFIAIWHNHFLLLV